MHQDMRIRRVVPAIGALLVGAFLAVLFARPGGAHATRTFDDLAQLAAAMAGALAGAWRGSRLTGRARASWWLLGAGCAAWAVGEAIWCYYELIAGRETPFPSAADGGFLLFPVLALAGLLVRPSAAFSGQGRVRVALDAVLVSSSLAIVSWVSALGEVYRAGADSTFAAVVSLAYPGTDVVLLSVTVVVLAFARSGGRAGLAWISAGIVALAFGDSGFAYLTAKGSYGTVNVVDAGWVAGFLLLAIAAVLDEQHDDEERRDAPTPRIALLLPYLPAATAVGVVLNQLAEKQLDRIGAAAACAGVVALIGRQMLVLLDNRALMSR